MKDFIRGMDSINLFPEKRSPIKFTPISMQEIFKKSLERVGNAMYYAISEIEKEMNGSEKNGK